jgi:hypothetical protein
MLTTWPLLAALAVGPSLGDAPDSAPAYDPIERLSGYSSVILNHVNRALGDEHLPVGNGLLVEPGVFVTLGLDRLFVFDQEQMKLQNGRVADRTVAPECVSRCAAQLYDAFQYEWLKLAVESAALSVDIPVTVHFAAHQRLPATTLIEAAYAISETRPGLPPGLSMLVNAPGRGLRALPFFLIPPRGLELQQGSAALGLSIEFGQGIYKINASDPGFASEARVKRLSQLRLALLQLKKRYPNKGTVILIPDDTVSVGQLMQLVGVAVSADFTRIVLSLGQDVYV